MMIYENNIFSIHSDFEQIKIWKNYFFLSNYIFLRGEH